MFPLENPQYQNLATFGLVIVLVAAFLFSIRSTSHRSLVGTLIWLGGWILFSAAAFSFINGMNPVAIVCIAAWGGLWVIRELTQKEVGRPEI